MSILALHGFLGHGADFENLKLDSLRACSIFRTQITSLSRWALRFNNLIPKDRPIIMGYSMGGRLALHCLLNNPALYRAAIIFSAHPGLADNKLKIERYEADKAWSRRFLCDPWETLMRDWHKQPALCSSGPILRSEGDFDRYSLSSALRQFSLGSQEYLTPLINALDIPILWVAPHEEACNVAEIKLRNSSSRLVLMPTGGHRFMIQEPALCSVLIRDFLKELE